MAGKTVRRKKGRDKETVVYMHPDLAAYFKSLPTSDDPKAPVFPSLYGKKSGSHGGLSNAFNRLMELAGIRVPLGSEKRGKGRRFKALGFHSLRHSFISGWLMPRFQPMSANSLLDTQATIFTGATFIWIFRYRQKLSLVCPACCPRQQNVARPGGSGRVSPLLEL